MRTVEVLQEPTPTVTVVFTDGRKVTVDGRVARMVECLLEERATLESMEMGGLQYQIGADSFQVEVRIVKRRRKTPSHLRSVPK